MRPPERMTTAQWADRHRILDERTSAQPGPWRTNVTPYLRGVMDAFTDPDVEELWLCKPTQVGGTEAILNMIAYAIAQDPAPTLVVYPTLELARWTSVNRLQPMIAACPELRSRYLLRDSTDLELQFVGMYLTLAGANSPASLATRPIRYLFLDEVDKYPAGAGHEADPIALAQERTKTFVYNRKIVGTSTPTYRSGHIWRRVESAGELRRYFVPCPHCGHYQFLRFSRETLRWPEGCTAEDAIDLAWYECEGCKGRIGDQHKGMMLRTGEWRCVTRRGAGARIVACHLNTLASPWVRFGEMAAKFLRTKDDPDELKNFVNSWLGEPWETATAKVDADVVLERQTETPTGVVPEGAVLLTGGVDVQEDRFYWTVRAWGTRLTSWNVAHGEALDWGQIEQIMNRPWPREQGADAQVNLVAVDSGDQTDDVYAFCARNLEWARPVKGSSQSLLSRYRITRVDRPTSAAHGMQLVLVDTDQYKTLIASRQNRTNGPGSWMVHADCDRDYAEQVTAEHCVEETRGGQVKRVWRRKHGSAANHYLDAEVYAAVAADLLQVRYLDDGATPGDSARNTPAAPPSPQPRTQQQQPNWLPPRRDWL
jgi:phage terminase large subunit GpA-like protein